MILLNFLTSDNFFFLNFVKLNNLNMTSKFIKFWVAAIFLLTAMFSFAGPQNLVITTSGRLSTFCVGSDETIKVYVVDTTGEITNFSYQWYYSAEAIMTNASGWTEIAGAEESVLSFASVALADTGYYYCKIFYGVGSSKRSPSIEVRVVAGLPTIIGISAVPEVCEGERVDMVADVTNYQIQNWYFGGERISQGSSCTISSASTANAGEYTFVAENVCGEVENSFVFAVNELPRIVSQPRSAGICAGDDLHFVVQATGTNLQYQWYYDGAPYPAVNHSDTNDTLTIAQAEHDPELYSNTFNVQVSNMCATVTSINVGTIVSEMPNIVGNPMPETVCAGVEVNLYADATTDYPTDTITYQWYLDGVPVEGEISNIITFAMDSAHMGEYYCEFTNGCGTVRSNSAQAIVKMPATVESQPVDVSVCEGEAAQLYAKITGVEPIQYTWLNSNGEGLDFTDITTENTTGVHTSTLMANPASASHERYYYCLATNECGSVRTDTVYMHITQEIVVYPSLPENYSLCSNIDTTISIADRVYQGSTLLDADDFEAEGITFAWHRQGEADILSSEPYLRFADLQDDDAGRYVCDVTNPCGTNSAVQILISVIVSPTILEQPQDLDVCAPDGSLTLSLSAEGNDLSYAWYRNGEFVSTNNPYYAPTIAPEYGGEYWCIVRSGYGCPSAYSDTVTVTVGTTPVITWQPTPASMAICEGEEYALRMRADGDGIHYQWYNNGTAISGQTTDSLHIDHVTRNNDGVFYCIASNACAEARTNMAMLTVNNAPDMTLGPDRHPCRGESILLGPQGDEEYAHYSWNYGTFGYQPTLTVNLGGTYILEVSDSAHGNCVARDTVIVTYHDYFDIAFDTTPIVTCGEFVLDAGVGATEYLWSTTDISHSITVGMNGYYMVTVDGDGYGCTTSAGVNITIGDEIVIDLGDDFSASVDSDVELSVPSVFDEYVWNTGFTGPRLTISGEDYGVGPHTFWVRVATGECYASDTIVINFLEGGYVNEMSVPVASIYPNPASDYVNIVSANGEMSAVQVYDITGKLVQDIKLNDEAITLNVAAMVDATYFVRIIYKDGNTGVSKLIINR